MGRILVFTDWFVPGYAAGGPIRSVANLVKMLQSEFEIWIITSDRDFQSSSSYSGIPINEWLNFDTNIKVYYTSISNQKTSFFRKLIKQINPDTIYLNSMFSFRFTLIPLWLFWKEGFKSRVVIAPRGMLHDGAMQYKTTKKKASLWLLRQSQVIHKITFHATDEQESKDIQKRLEVAPGQIQIAENIPLSPKPSILSLQKKSKELKMIFLSRISPKKNLIFLLDLIKEIKKTGEILLTIVGPVEDTTYWESCKKRIEDLPPNIAVNVKGAIPHHKVQDLLEENHFFVLPTYGENYGHIIFEAFAVGRPVIISDQTPWRGLETRNVGWDLPLSEPEAWKAALHDALAMNAQEYNHWSRSAHSFAQEYLAKQDLVSSYKKLFSK